MRLLTKIKDTLRNIKYGLQNFWKYKGLIWNDRDWDWVYLYRMMEFKLLEMAALHRKYGICSNTEEIAQELEEAAGCLGRLCEDGYDEEDYMRNHLQAREDLKRFCKLFEESKGWWD